jgi:tRNA-dihydrouridine synthase
MKMRLGYDTTEEILDVFPILEKYPIKNVAIHARIGKQLYKGGVHLDAFKPVLITQSSSYITTVILLGSEVPRNASPFPSIEHWMIGRGLISDPFTQYDQRQQLRISKIKWNYLVNFTIPYTQATANLYLVLRILLKMHHLWEYFSVIFEPHKVAKNIKSKAFAITSRQSKKL